MKKNILILMLIIVTYLMSQNIAESDREPDLVEPYRDGYLINFNTEIDSTEMMEGEIQITYRYEQVFVSRNASRNEIISAIIHNLYPVDDELARINNYLSTPADSTVVNEYNEYQERRAFAKDLADDVMEVLE